MSREICRTRNECNLFDRHDHQIQGILTRCKSWGFTYVSILHSSFTNLSCLWKSLYYFLTKQILIPWFWGNAMYNLFFLLSHIWMRASDTSVQIWQFVFSPHSSTSVYHWNTIVQIKVIVTSCESYPPCYINYSVPYLFIFMLSKKNCGGLSSKILSHSTISLNIFYYHYIQHLQYINSYIQYNFTGKEFGHKFCST